MHNTAHAFGHYPEPHSVTTQKERHTCRTLQADEEGIPNLEGIKGKNHLGDIVTEKNIRMDKNVDYVRLAKVKTLSGSCEHNTEPSDCTKDNGP
jgi:hypothetical protein